MLRTLLAGAGVARAGLRVMGRHRFATLVTFGIAVVYFAVTLAGRADAATAGNVTGTDAVAVSGIGLVAWWVRTLWHFVGIVVVASAGLSAGLVGHEYLRNRRRALRRRAGYDRVATQRLADWDGVRRRGAGARPVSAHDRRLAP